MTTADPSTAVAPHPSDEDLSLGTPIAASFAQDENSLIID